MLKKFIFSSITGISAIIAMSIIVGLSTFFSLKNIELATSQKEFLYLLDSKIPVIRNTIKSTHRSVRSISSMFAIKQTVHPYSDFRPFIMDSQSGISGTYSLGWIGIISHVDRNSTVTEFRSYGREYSKFDLTIRSNGSIVSAPNFNTYYSLLYVEPLATNIGALGFNLYTEPIRRNAIDRSITSRNESVTSKLFLPHTKYTQPGVLYLTPTITNNTLIGFGVGVFIIGDMINADMTDFMPYSTVSVFDTGLHDEYTPSIVTDMSSLDVQLNTSTFLWSSTGEYGPTFGTDEHINSIKKLHTSYSYKITLQVADRYWTIVFTPTNLHMSKYSYEDKWVALFASFGIGILLAIMYEFVVIFVFYRFIQMENIKNLEIKMTQESADKQKNLMNFIAMGNEAKKRLLDFSTEYICIVNSVGKILYYNNMFHKLTRVNEGVNIHDLFPNENPQWFEFTNEIKQMKLKPFIGATTNVDVLSRTLDIDEGVFISTVGNIKLGNGTVYYITIIDSQQDNLKNELNNDRYKLNQMLAESEFEKKWNGVHGDEFKHKILTYAAGLKNEENILFMLDVEQYKATQELDKRIELQNMIVDKYINDDSQYQLNLNSYLVPDFKKHAVKEPGTRSLFDNIYNSIKLLVVTDIYNKMIKE